MCDHLSSVLLFQVSRYYSPTWYLLSFLDDFRLIQSHDMVIWFLPVSIKTGPSTSQMHNFKWIDYHDPCTRLHIQTLDAVLSFPRFPLILWHPQYYPVMCPSGRSHHCSHSSFVDDYLHTYFSQRIFPTVVPSASNFTYAVHCCLWLSHFQAELPNHHFAIHQIAD